VKSFRFDDIDEISFRISFLNKKKNETTNKIEYSRNWYEETYKGIPNNGYQRTKYPIQELKKYADWLENEIKNIDNENNNTQENTIAIETQQGTIPTVQARLKEWLENHGIWNLRATTNLTNNQKEFFLERIFDYTRPKLIAMLHCIEYIEYLEKNYYKGNKAELYKQLGSALGTDARTIKGNIYTLHPHSQENRERYTSHTFIETVLQEFDEIARH
jgi:hypothetical protein